MIDNNYIHDVMRTKAHGIWNDVNAHKITVRYNRISKVATGLWFENGTSGNKAYYNILEGCDIGIKCGDTSNSGVYDNEIYNNLIIGSKYSFEFLHDANGRHTIKK